MAKLKIKPKDFQKRRSQSKTFKDWNDENGSSVAYKTTKKRKPTVLDECEHYSRTPLNNNTRLDGSEDIGQAISKIADGNREAGIVLLTVMSKVGTSKIVSCLLSLDSLGYYGAKINELWETVNEDPAEFVEMIEDILHGDR
jgi:peroxiredoxin family protein